MRLRALGIATSLVIGGAAAVVTTTEHAFAACPGIGAGGVSVYTGSNENIVGAQPIAAAGVCLDTGGTANPGGTFYGGNLEAGVGGTGHYGFGGTGPVPSVNTDVLAGPGAYVIVDGDNRNSDPTGESAGYIGVSNYESSGTPGYGPQDACGANNQAGSGSNSGGSVGLKATCNTGTPADAVTKYGLPLPIACGNVSSPSWGSTPRDGCWI